MAIRFTKDSPLTVLRIISSKVAVCKFDRGAEVMVEFDKEITCVGEEITGELVSFGELSTDTICGKMYIHSSVIPAKT